jgi:arylformamidase
LGALRNAQKPAEIVFAEGYNHFELIETIANPYGVAGRVRLKQMGLS